MTIKPTNEELIERLQAAVEGTREAAAIMGELWAQNAGLVRLAVLRLTGLHMGEAGFEDMEQQAYFGFHAAVYSFDLLRGLKFSTYAVNRIRWELCRYYERNGYTVHIPAYMKRRLRDCMKKRQEFEAETGRPVTYEVTLKAILVIIIHRIRLPVKVKGAFDYDNIHAKRLCH